MTEKMRNLLQSNPEVSLSSDTGRGLILTNPFITASGTYGYGTEYSDLCPADDWGAVVLKSVTPLPRKGNTLPRCCDTDSGMLNSIGLANVGIEKFLSEKMPEFTGRFPDAAAVSSIAGETIAEFISLASLAGNSPGVKAVEINISCPNVSRGGILFSSDASSAAEVVKECRKATKLPLWVKISPASADPIGIAAVCAEAGADAIVASNTFPGMLIDIYKRAPVLGNKTGGLSGPAIFPASLRIAYIIAKALPGINLIGCGGIDCADKAIQFILAGCSAVQIGAAMFRSPDILYRMTSDLKSYMQEAGFNSIKDFRGAAL
jgi:dihydroorotate dehydrogenase (NAD+) catalytic subunit